MIMRRIFKSGQRVALRDVAIFKKWEECAMPAEQAVGKI